MTKIIIWLTGASGVGKTTLLENLKEKYSSDKSWEFLKFDSIGVPSTEDMIKEFGSGENWQKAKTFEWINKMLGEPNKNIIIIDGQSNLNFIIEGFNRENFLNYKIILIDCAQETMVKRLTNERQQAWLASEDMKNWLKFLRNQALGLDVAKIDTTNLTKQQTVSAFEIIINNRPVA